jgi:hypothetical protein
MFKFQIDWVFDKLGYMPKIKLWDFPAFPTKPVKKVAKKTAKKTIKKRA